MQKYPGQDPTLPQGFTITFRDRFWRRVNKNGPLHPYKPELGKCWIWIGGADGLGYGLIKVGSRNTKLMRASHATKLIHNQPIPDSMIALHSCDNPRCVNPDHIFSGTHADNRRDMLSKGRQVVCRTANAKLTLCQINDIRISLLTTTALSKTYSVNKSTISRIRNFRTWYW